MAPTALRARPQPLKSEIAGPFFAGGDVAAVDVVFAPAFRQLDRIETIRPLGLPDGLPKLGALCQAGSVVMQAA